ncbi:MAG: CHRD domain-containing protein, partial [Chitinophagaceae bacterium]|nr:CHRD domain-containing protein [Chitinophagaceae bacterium]
MRPRTLTAAIGTGALALGLGMAGAQDTGPRQATIDPLVAAATATHVASLANDNVIPPVETTAGGTAWLFLDAATHTLSWTVEYAGLTGPATAASFHGPAGAAANAPAVLGLGVQNPIQGNAQLTAEQAAQLDAGQWYISLSTGNNPEGEIRGQVLPVEADAAAAPADDAALMATLMADGQAVYSANCRVCHGGNGEGGNGPELAGYSLLA